MAIPEFSIWHDTSRAQSVDWAVIGRVVCLYDLLCDSCYVYSELQLPTGEGNCLVRQRVMD
jgi:hypothetical protein